MATSVVFEELWGWDRPLPYDLVLEDPSDLPMYESYLEQFYNLNSGAASDHYNSKAAADAALKVIKVTACLPASTGLVFSRNPYAIPVVEINYCEGYNGSAIYSYIFCCAIQAQSFPH